MKEIYLDNAATSYPKAPGVAETVTHFLSSIGCNVSRGAYTKAYQAEEVIYETRELLCRLFHFDNPENVVFTSLCSVCPQNFRYFSTGNRALQF